MGGLQAGQFAAELRWRGPGAVALTSSEQAGLHEDVPTAWVEVLRRQERGDKGWLPMWEPFADLLPGVLAFLRTKVRGCAVLCGDGAPASLLYLFGRGARSYFYVGGTPLAGRVPVEAAPVWPRLPSRLQRFYDEVHDGWTCMDAIGPLPVRMIKGLDNWELEPKQEAALPFRLAEALAVFANGGGDALCVDTARDRDDPGNGIVAWHDDPEMCEAGVDLWAELDGWFSAQREDVDVVGEDGAETVG